jgi:phage replication O-like protein O
MANPQTEDGYSPIANELLEALYHAKLTGGELRVILCVIRASYGWSQPVAPISISEVARRIGRVRPYIQQTVSTLMARGILARNGEGLYLVKDYELWRDDTNTPCNTELTCNPRVIPPVAPVLHLPITPLLQDMQPNPSPVKALRAPKSISKSSTKTNICDAPSASPTVRQSGTTRRIPRNALPSHLCQGQEDHP